MMQFGTILKSRIGKNRDATQNTQLLQTQLTEKEDVQEIEEMHFPGVQYNPPVKSTGFIARVSEAFKFMVGINDNVPKLENLNPGERKAYGSKDGAIVCSLWYKDNGTIQIDTDKDLDVNATKVNVIVSDSVNITAPGNVNVTGNILDDGAIDAADNISSEADVIADSNGVPISLLNHTHLGNLGYNTGISLPAAGGVAPPTNPPHSDSTGDLITGDNNYSVDTLKNDFDAHIIVYDAHIHFYTWTGTAGSGNTGTPI